MTGISKILLPPSSDIRPSQNGLDYQIPPLFSETSSLYLDWAFEQELTRQTVWDLKNLNIKDPKERSKDIKNLMKVIDQNR